MMNRDEKRLSLFSIHHSAFIILFFLLLALILMLPYYPRQMLMSPGGDLMNHTCAIVEATNALRDGQFPIRVAPDVLERGQYPIFNFYGNLPYTVGGLFCLIFKVGPYTAYRLVMGLSYIAGGWYIFRTGVWITGKQWASLIAGAVFMTSPYMFTDVHARAAFVEAVSFNVLPAVFFYAMRCISRGTWGDILASGVAWCALCLSHNVTVLYAAVLFGLLFLLMMPRPIALLRVAGGGAIGIVLSLWYLVPALQLVPNLQITQLNQGVPVGSETLTSLSTLLSPVAHTPIRSTTAHLDLQIGILILAGAVATAVLLAVRRSRLRDARAVLALLVVFCISAWVAWTPVREHWLHVPRIFWHVQSSSRLLMFTSLFGSVLAAVALSHLPVRGSGGRAFLLAMIAVACAAQSFVYFRERWLAGMDYVALTAPNLGGNGASSAYLCSSEFLERSSIKPGRFSFLPVEQTRSQSRFSKRVKWSGTLASDSLVQIPMLFYPNALEVTDNDRQIAYGNVGPYVALQLRAGNHLVRARFVGSHWANLASGAGWLIVLSLGGVTAFRRGRQRVGHAMHEPALLTPGRVALAAGLFGVVLLAPQLVGRIRHVVGRQPEMTITASRQSGDPRRFFAAAQASFDGDPTTAWLVDGAKPVTLALQLKQPARLKRIHLHARWNMMVEQWQHLHFSFYVRGKQVGTFDENVADAHWKTQTTFDLPRVEADRIEIEFSQPVLTTRDGLISMAPAQVEPGYTEIETEWER